MFSRILQISGFVVITSMFLITASAFFISHWLNTPLKLENEKIIAVQSGDTLAKLSQFLADEKIIQYPKLLVLYSRLTKKTNINIGEYKIPVGTTPEKLISILQSSDVISYRALLLDGKTYQYFLDSLHEKNNIKPLLQTLSIEEQLALIGADIDHPEGWFFPDTYVYTSGTSDVDVLRRAHQAMKKIVAEEWEARAENLPYENAYEALIMASIIEKETGVASEREEIAGVFVRRLQKGMRLQTDPTIIYGLGDEYQGNLRRRHLTQKTPYNTYMIDGLPPTPIAMPGREAIYAALHPKAGESLYFVAKGDGSHYFSSTLDEHNKAVRQYQIENRKKDYRSSPAPEISK